MNALVDVGVLDRRTYLGGSDLPAILGVSPFATPLDVYYAKTQGEPELDVGKAAFFARRKKLEPFVLDMLHDEQPIEIAARNHRYRDRGVPFLAAEIDYEWNGEFRWTVDGEPVSWIVKPGAEQNGEIKTVSVFAAKAWGESETDEIPTYVAAQAMWGLGITGRRYAVVTALFGADALVNYRVERDDELIAEMRRRAVEFWERHVVALVPPPPVNLDDVARLWPKDVGTTIEATPEVAAALTTLTELRKRGTILDDAKAGVELIVAEHMKDATTLTLAGEPIATRKAQKRSFVDADALQHDFPDAYKACLRTSEFRVIRKKGER